MTTLPTYRVGDPDTTPESGGDMCAAPTGAYHCTRDADHLGQHAAGDGEVILHVWRTKGRHVAPVQSFESERLEYLAEHHSLHQYGAKHRAEPAALHVVTDLTGRPLTGDLPLDYAVQIADGLGINGRAVRIEAVTR